MKKILQLPKLYIALQAGLWRKKLLYSTNPALRMQNTSSDSKTWKSSRVFWKRTIAFNTERNLQKHWPNGILESIRRKPQFLGTAHHFKGSDGRQYRKSPLGELELKRRTIAPACLAKVQSFSTSTSDGCPSQRTFSFLQTQQLHQPRYILLLVTLHPSSKPLDLKRVWSRTEWWLGHDIGLCPTSKKRSWDSE
jgi:hypothetical protein